MQEQAHKWESCLAQLVELKPFRVNERSAPRRRWLDDGEDDGEDDEEGAEHFLSMARNFLVAGTCTLFLETLECA